MINTTRYFFDTLPLHPPPEPLESLTSYSTRLMEANRLYYISDLAPLCFPDQTIACVRGLKDYPLSTLETLSRVASCSEATLWAMTFYHLGKKFDRSSSAHPLSAFLSGCVARYLRYCPICLDEFSYYSLMWRFIPLRGCTKHSCHLLEVCGHCGNPIPIFSVPLKMGICSRCNGDLRACRSKMLIPEAKQSVREFSQDLEWLLSPQPWEDTVLQKTVRLGQEFLRMRRNKGLKASQVIQHTQIVYGSLVTLENGFSWPKVTNFLKYLEYASYLGVSIRYLFNSMLQQDIEEVAQARTYQGRTAPCEEEVIEKVDKAVSRLQSMGRAVNQRAISELVCISLTRLRSYPQVRLLLKGFMQEMLIKEEEDTSSKENDVLDKVQTAIEYLKSVDQPITYQRVSEQIGVRVPTLKCYPKVKALLEQELNYHQFQMKQAILRENERFSQVQSLVEDLERSGIQITYLAISARIGMHIDSLKKCYRIRALIEEKMISYLKDQNKSLSSQKEVMLLQEHNHTQEMLWSKVSNCPKNMQTFPTESIQEEKYRYSHVNEDSLFSKVEVAIQSLQESGKLVTRHAVAQLIGVSANTLIRRRPRIKALLDEKAVNYKLHRIQEARLQEDKLFSQAKIAVAQLEFAGKPVTKQAVCEIVGKSPSSLYRHARINMFVKQSIVSDKPRDMQSCLAEDELVKSVEHAIEFLKSHEIKITQKGISKIVELDIITLKSYPRVKAALTNAIVEKQQSNVQGFYVREENLLATAEIVVQQLLDEKQQLTQQSISEMMGVPLSTLCYYPKVISFIRRLVMEKRQQVLSIQFQKREEELVIKVTEAIQQLQQAKKPLSVNAITRVVLLSSTGLMLYPRVKTILEPIAKGFFRDNTD